MNFDEPVQRRGTTSLKWDGVGRATGLSGDDVLPMWVADMDFRTAPVIRQALADLAEFGLPAYMSDLDAMRDSVAWWMQTRHGWRVPEEAVLTVNGIGNGIAMAIDALTEPGDGVVLFTPVYHEFAARVRAAGRRPVQVPLAVRDGRQTFDLGTAGYVLDGSETLVLLSSPQNPGGRVWTRDELSAVARFADVRGLTVVSDEIHHDLVYPGADFVPMALADRPERFIALTSPSKTFNTAGLRTGHIIAEDKALRETIRKTLDARSVQPNIAGVASVTAAYSPQGAAWADALMVYLDANRQAFDAAVNALPGVRSVPLEATFLAWVDFSGTGMDQDEIEERVFRRARIAVNRGPTFGPGGELHLRFNIGTQRAHIDDAAERLAAAFSDLQ